MQFRQPHLATSESDPGRSFHLPPVALPIQAPEARKIANTSTGRDRLNVSNLSKELEIHRTTILATSRQTRPAGKSSAHDDHHCLALIGLDAAPYFGPPNL